MCDGSQCKSIDKYKMSNRSQSNIYLSIEVAKGAERAYFQIGHTDINTDGWKKTKHAEVASGKFSLYLATEVVKDLVACLATLGNLVSIISVNCQQEVCAILKDSF